MQTLDDRQLLREYAATQCEEAFATLVSRHLNLVYSAALRQVQNPHYAEEIAQAVFLVLARKCRALRPGVILSGWLYQTARLTSANFLRGEFRRRQREQEAYMQSTLNEGPTPSWPQIAPLLEEAMGKLSEKDRNAIVMRYFEGKEMRAIAEALGSSEDAAKMRLSRAVEKLRTYFVRRGLPISGAGLAAVISEFSVQAAPASLAATVTTGVCGGTVAAASVLTLTKGTLTMMAWTKINIGIAAVAVAAVAYQWHEATVANRKADQLQQQLAHQTELYNQQQTQLQRLQERNASLAQQAESIATAPSGAQAPEANGAARQGTKGGSAPAGGGLNGAALAKMLKDPAMKKMMQDQQKSMLKTEYGDLVKQLKLTPDQTEKFYTLMLDQQTSNMDRGMSMLSGGSNPQDMAKAAKDLQDTTDAQLRELLGDDGLAQYKEYSDGLVDKTRLTQMSASFTDPLTQDQQNQLLQVMRAARQNAQPVPGQAATPDPATMAANFDQYLDQQQQIDSEVLQQAGSFLSAQQLQDLGNSQTNFLNMQKASMTMVRSMIGTNMPSGQ